MKNSRLSEKIHWESQYLKKKGRLKALLKDVVLDGSHVLYPLLNINDYILWKRLLPRFIKECGRGKSVLEIGSAPGYNLIKFSKNFGLDPYGIDYSEEGIEINKENFIRHGLSFENLIKCDFFNSEFVEKSRSRFDIVSSFGFVEHFEETQPVINRHTRLVRRGGLLIVLIPNLLGLSGKIAKFFDRSSYQIHNLEVMNRDCFANLFEDDYEALYCGFF